MTIHRAIACATLFTGAWLSVAGPAQARFLQADPVGYKDDPNMYAYVGNSPVNRVDPKGLYSCGGSLSPDQCSGFTNAQNQAKTQIARAMNKIGKLRSDLASAKLTAQDKAVANVISNHLGSGAGTDTKVLGNLLGEADKMMDVLNSNMPAQNGFSSSDYAHADAAQLTLFPNHWASSPNQQIETIAHESSHHGAHTTDTPELIDLNQRAIQPYGHRNIGVIAGAENNPYYMLGIADAVTLALGLNRDDDYK